VDQKCPSAVKSRKYSGRYFSYFSCVDDVDELRTCPWKAPIDFFGELLPLSPATAKKLLENSGGEGRGTPATVAAAKTAEPEPEPSHKETEFEKVLRKIGLTKTTL